MKSLSPIILFVFNRPQHTRKTVESLAANYLSIDSELFIFSDGPKHSTSVQGIKEVRKYVKQINGFKKVNIIERKDNYGLASSIISGVTEIISRFGKVIVLEDDMITSPYFLKFMNDALDFYQDNAKVISVHGYMYPVRKQLPETFFLRMTDCWGWATWKRGWELFEADGKKLLEELKVKYLEREFNFNHSYDYISLLENQIAGRNDSWAIRWYASAFLKGKLGVFPGISLVKNIGLDSTGTHCITNNQFDCFISTKPIKINNIPVLENQYAKKLIQSYFISLKPTLFRRNMTKIKSALKKFRNNYTILSSSNSNKV